MKLNLPIEWAEIITLDAFSQISTTGKKVKTAECNQTGKYPVIDQGQLAISGYIDDPSKLITIKNPIILFGDHTRAIKWINFDFVPGADGTKLLETRSFIEPRFAFYQLLALEIPDKGYSRHFKYLKEIVFRVPPLAEQKVIADKLDELLAQVDTLKARLDAIPTILKRFRQSVLAAAVSGKLTEEWRLENPNLSSGTEVLTRWLQVRQKSFAEDQALRVQKGLQKRPKQFKEPVSPDLERGIESPPESWATVSVSQFAECLDNIRVPVTKADRNSAKGLYPYFGANGEVDRVDEYLFDDELVLVTEDETFYGRVKPIAYRFSGKCWVNNHAHVLRAPTKDANDFLCYALMYYNVIPWLSGTTGRAKLTQGALNSLPVFLPPEEEQAEIVRKVEQLFTYADQVEQQVKNAQARVNQLTQSILAKAFRGELTEQWRQDNPELISGENSAAALLERIKAERAAATPAKKKAPARKAKA